MAAIVICQLRGSCHAPLATWRRGDTIMPPAATRVWRECPQQVLHILRFFASLAQSELQLYFVQASCTITGEPFICGRELASIQREGSGEWAQHVCVTWPWTQCSENKCSEMIKSAKRDGRAVGPQTQCYKNVPRSCCCRVVKSKEPRDSKATATV